MPKIHEKLCKIWPRVQYVQKDAKNDFHKYKYASAEKVLGKVAEELAAIGISVQSKVEILKATADLGSVITHVTLILTDAETGETATFEGTGQGSDKGDKAAMKAQTAATKYALASGFLISWGDDPEADSSTDQRAALAEEVLATVRTKLEVANSKEQVDAVSAWVGGICPPATLRPAIQSLFDARRRALGITVGGNGNGR